MATSDPVIDASEPRQPKREARPLARAGAVVLAIVIAVGKVEALRSIFGHGQTYAFVLLGLIVLGAVLKGRALTMAGALAAILAIALAPHPVWLGIATGVGAFLLLVTVAVLASLIARRLDQPEPGFGSGWLPS